MEEVHTWVWSGVAAGDREDAGRLEVVVVVDGGVVVPVDEIGLAAGTSWDTPSMFRLQELPLLSCWRMTTIHYTMD